MFVINNINLFIKNMRVQFIIIIKMKNKLDPNWNERKAKFVN